MHPFAKRKCRLPEGLMSKALRRYFHQLIREPSNDFYNPPFPQ
jgi:hypothetical protein